MWWLFVKFAKKKRQIVFCLGQFGHPYHVLFGENENVTYTLFQGFADGNITWYISNLGDSWQDNCSSLL